MDSVYFVIENSIQPEIKNIYYEYGFHDNGNDFLYFYENNKQILSLAQMDYFHIPITLWKIELNNSLTPQQFVEKIEIINLLK